MNIGTEHSEFEDRINNGSITVTWVSSVLCAVSHLFDNLAQWHTRRTLRRQARQELEELSDAALKDIGLFRGDIGNLADDLASRARHCR